MTTEQKFTKTTYRDRAGRRIVVQQDGGQCVKIKTFGMDGRVHTDLVTPEELEMAIMNDGLVISGEERDI